MIITIRTRLTLWYTSLLVVTLLLLGSLVYGGVWWLARADADEVLRTKFQSVSAEVEYEDGVLQLDVAQSPPGSANIEEGLDLLLVIDASGKPLHELRRQTGLPASDPSLHAALAGRETWEEFQLDHATFRVYSGPVVTADGVIAALQVGRLEGRTDAVLGSVRLVGAGAMILGVALAWFGGHFLAGRALAPIERIRRGAEAISAQDLSRRLGPPYPTDELGDLTRSLDGMIDRLDHAFERERQFTSDASHELRTPLSIVRTQLEVALRQDRSSSEYQELLAVLLEETARLSKLVESMLTLARIDAGQRPEFTATALHDVVLMATDRLLPQLEQRGLTLHIDRMDPVTVLGESGWLTQIVLELVQNAAQHTPRGGSVQLDLRAENSDAVLRVVDTGEGIDPEHLPRIFDRFYRANSARSRLDGGAGLGLAICAWAIRAHGGAIRAESVPGKGSTFVVTLPAHVSGTLHEANVISAPIAAASAVK